MNLIELIPLGATHSAKLIVTHDLTVQARVPELPPVYSTPNMVLVMELVCSELLKTRLPAEWVSVGAFIDVRHLAATPVGFEVTVKATVVDVSEKLVTFELEAHDDVDLIGSAKHARAPIESARFMRGVEKKRAARFG
ncbi:MAG: thioesterase [Gammaproteobacteria bacterium]|nr:thioesterase [Gammaproteobacteria bacterium]